MKDRNFVIPLLALVATEPVAALSVNEEGAFAGINSLLTLGGPVVLILLAASIAGFTVVLYKILQLRLFSRTSFDDIDRILGSWTAGDPNGTTEQLKQQSNPVASILIDGISWIENNDSSHELVREELTRRGSRVMVGVNSMLRVLEQIAYLAPLLGLLGTVLGIIGVFQGLASSSNGADAGAMAGGIWEALLTTAVGLSIAIPFALMSAALENRAAYIQARIQDQLSRLFTLGLAPCE